MNLLTNSQDDDLQKRILTVIGETGVSEDEMNVARNFFNFSKEIDLSLLEELRYRNLNFNVLHRNSCLLYSDLLRLPGEKSYKATDRYILFFDAVAGNTIGRLLLYGPYYYHYNNTDLSRVIHAYEIKYSPEDVKAKIAAFISYGISAEKVLFNLNLIQTAVNEPIIMYKAGKGYCFEEESFARARLYSLALAYRKEYDFTEEQLNEMESYLLQKNEELSIHYSADLENIVLMLFMSVNYGTEIKKQLQIRLKAKFEKILPAIIQFIPSDCFEKNMDVLIDIAKNSDNMTIEKLIKLVIRSSVVSDAFENPKSCYCSENSIKFLELLAKKYTEEYIASMTANEPVGVGARWGYYFDYYNELSQLLKKAVPDVNERYSLDIEKEMIQMTIHREAMDVKNTIRREVMDYLNGNADVSTIESIRSELAENHQQWNSTIMTHELRVLSQLKEFTDFYGRYVAYKMIQNVECIKQYIVSLIRNDKGTEEVKQIFTYAIRENISIDDRIRTFEVIYTSIIYYMDKYKKQVMDKIVEVMTENSEKCDSDYERECMKHQPYTCCCYINYLDRTNTDNKNKDRLLALCGESSKEIRRTLIDVLVKYKEYEQEIKEMISAKKQSIREMAVDILALWGTDKYRELLEKAADTEKSVKLSDKIRSLLSASVSTVVSKDGERIFSPISFVEEIHRGGRARKISWLFDKSLPQVHFKNGNIADGKYMQAIILCYSSMPVPGRNENAMLLAEELNNDELNHYAAEIFSRWYSAGAESKTRWAMYFAIIHGGGNIIEVALKCVKDWAENMRGAIAAETTKAIALNGSSFALMAVDNLAHKFKQKQVKKAAIEAMETAAEALGITADELGDRIVPDLGFNQNMERIFDYGERKFKVYILPKLELEIFDENDKKLKNLPLPAKKDDETMAKQSIAEFKALKKQLKNVISVQKIRIETALLADRRWKKDAWETLFVKNPVMHSFAIGLIWAAYNGDEIITFRYMEDGTFNTVDEDEFILPENCDVGLVHPIELDEKTLSAWKEQLKDYEIVQPIEQLNRKIYRVTDDECGKIDLERFRGRSINALSLAGRAAKFGWLKGSAQDAGLFYVFYREDVTSRVNNGDGSFTFTGNAVEMHFSGCYISVENEDVTIENVRFYRPGTIEHGSYVYDEADENKSLPLDKIPSRYFSEIVLQLDEMTKSAEKQS